MSEIGEAEITANNKTKTKTKHENVNEWSETSFPFFRSPEGESEYRKLGMEYPKTLMDYNYMRFEKLTKNTKKEDQKMYIPQMKRLILADKSEYIVYSMTETKYDALKNRKTFSRSGIGMYAKPVPKREIKARIDPEEGFVREIVTTVDFVEVGYSLRFDQKTINKLLPYTDGNTQYSIQKMDYKSGMKFSIASLEDWHNGTVEELLRFGHKASSYEKEILAEEKIGKFRDRELPVSRGLYK